MTAKVAIAFFQKLAFELGAADTPSVPPVPPVPPISPASGPKLPAAPTTPKLTAAPARGPKLKAAPPAPQLPAAPVTPRPTPALAAQPDANTRNAARINGLNNGVTSMVDAVESTRAGKYLVEAGTGMGNFFGGVGNTAKGLAGHSLANSAAIAEAVNPYTDYKKIDKYEASQPAGVPKASPLMSRNLREIARGAMSDAGNSFGTMWGMTYPKHERQYQNSDQANTLAAQYDQIGQTPEWLANTTAFSRGTADIALSALPTAGLAAPVAAAGAVPKAMQVGSALKAVATPISKATIPAGIAAAPGAAQAFTQPMADTTNEIMRSIDPTYEPPAELATIGQSINSNVGPDGKVVSNPPSAILTPHTDAAKQLVTQDPAAAKQQADAAKAQMDKTLAGNKALASEAASWAKTGEVGQNTLNGAYKAVAGMVQDPSQILPTLQSMSTCLLYTSDAADE